jgi:hypothetical protein
MGIGSAWKSSASSLGLTHWSVCSPCQCCQSPTSQRSRASEAAAVALGLLNRRGGSLNEAIAAHIHALPLEQLEALSEALLDFSGPANLVAWLEQHGG